MKRLLIKPNTDTALLFCYKQLDSRHKNVVLYLTASIHGCLHQVVCMFTGERGHSICYYSGIIEERREQVPKKKSKRPAVPHPKTTGLAESTRHGVEHNKCVTNKACFRRLSLMQCYSLLAKRTHCRDIWRTH